jgi:hypothetical protein
MLMCDLERTGDLHRERQGFVQRKRACDRLALEELHNEIVVAAVGANVVERAYVRVVECRNGRGLPFEPLTRLSSNRVSSHDGHPSAESSIHQVVVVFGVGPASGSASTCCLIA